MDTMKSGKEFAAGVFQGLQEALDSTPNIDNDYAGMFLVITAFTLRKTLKRLEKIDPEAKLKPEDMLLILSQELLEQHKYGAALRKKMFPNGESR